MDQYPCTPKYIRIARFSCWVTFVLGIIYFIITILGFLSLNSPEEPIGDPYFTMMELSIMLVAPSNAISLIAIHYCTSPKDKIYSFISVFFMFLMVVISSCLHFVILTLGKQSEILKISDIDLVLSFKWPSVVYALDILAWDWFYGISILFLAPIFRKNGLEKVIKVLITICGILCLAGLLGVPSGNMQVRNIGIIGYGFIAPIIFLLIAQNFTRILRSTNQEKRTNKTV